MRATQRQQRSWSSTYFDVKTHDADINIGSDLWEAVDVPNMFVAILTARSSTKESRDAVRGLWDEVDDGTGSICARFAVCMGSDEYDDGLKAESAERGDLLFLNCSEGYTEGLLTKKVIAIMKTYRHAGDECLDRPLFMKADEDTFVAGHHFRQALSKAVASYGSSSIYAGVEARVRTVSRNSKSRWYEPYSTFAPVHFPPAMYGGTGYILGRQLVQEIVDEDIADSHILWNEDRAVGVWISVLEQHGAAISWVHFPGSNGFNWDHAKRKGKWRDYPYALHHHLSKECISCLVEMDRQNNPDAEIDKCFALDSS